MRLRKVLNANGPPKDQVKSWPVVGQYSSIGSLGATKDAWLATEFLQSLATVQGSSVVPLSSIDLKLVSKVPKLLHKSVLPQILLCKTKHCVQCKLLYRIIQFLQCTENQC